MSLTDAVMRHIIDFLEPPNRSRKWFEETYLSICMHIHNGLHIEKEGEEMAAKGKGNHGRRINREKVWWHIMHIIRHHSSAANEPTILHVNLPATTQRGSTICCKSYGSHKIKTKQRPGKPAVSGFEFPVTYSSWFPRQGTDLRLSLPTFWKQYWFLSITGAC